MPSQQRNRLLIGVVAGIVALFGWAVYDAFFHINTAVYSDSKLSKSPPVAKVATAFELRDVLYMRDTRMRQNHHFFTAIATCGAEEFRRKAFANNYRVPDPSDGELNEYEWIKVMVADAPEWARQRLHWETSFNDDVIAAESGNEARVVWMVYIPNESDPHSGRVLGWVNILWDTPD